MTDPQTPATEARRRLMLDFVSRDGDGEPIIKSGSDLAPYLADIEAEARASLGLPSPEVQRTVMEWLGPCCTHPTPGCIVCGFQPEGVR